MAELSIKHRGYLADHGHDPDFVLSLGVRSVCSVDDLADDEKPGIGRYLPEHPGILFPWTSVDGRKNVQLRPDDDKRPVDPKTGEPMKYVYQSGRAPVLWAARWVENPIGVLIPEGSKQTVMAARYAPEGWAVLGMAGAWGFSHDGMPISDLQILQGLDVVVGLDADAGSNFMVWKAGDRLDAALKAERVRSRRWLRLPAGGKAGLDDVLARRPEDKRASYLAALIEDASSKVADQRPKPPKRGKKEAATPLVASDGRRTVVVNEDRLTVMEQLTGALVDKFSGTVLFNHGDVISELKGTRMAPVDKGRFNAVIQRAALTINRAETDSGFVETPVWPDSNTMAGVLSEPEKFTPLDQVTRTPFIRPDGSICTTAGYDGATRTVLIPDEILAGIEVPDEPTDDDIAAARELIMTEWLGDFPWDTDADRANALALVVTPFIRALVPLVPLAVIDGTGKGVGKNLLADCLSILFTGQRDAKPMPYTRDDAEHRKVITAAFREGSSLFFFDEAHELEGAQFARAITSITYQDRILGLSRMAEFPNRVTWVSMGNNVIVEGDMVRRVYRIRIDPKTEHPEDRSSSSFRHPGISGLDLRPWTEVNRGRLLRAVLVLARAWFARGRNRAVRSESFGSFETWEGMTGGICALAGVPGFLGNLKSWRGATSFKDSHWAAHMTWLFEAFGNETFFATDVKNKAQKAGTDFFPGPPDNEDAHAKTFARVLGQQYAKMAGRWFDGLQVARTGTGKGDRVKWQLIGTPRVPEGSEGSERSEPNHQHDGEKHTPLRSDHVVTGQVKDTRVHAVEKGRRVPTVPTLPTRHDASPSPAPSRSYCDWGNSEHKGPGQSCHLCDGVS